LEEDPEVLPPDDEEVPPPDDEHAAASTPAASTAPTTRAFSPWCRKMPAGLGRDEPGCDDRHLLDMTRS
jgi:hypothetical protein